jgi:hypothetical protein
MIWKITKLLYICFCLLFIFIFSGDISEAIKYPELYPIGVESVSHLWHYKTQETYVLGGVLMILWFAVGILLCLLQYKFQKLRWIITIHFALSVSYLILQMYLVRFG